MANILVIDDEPFLLDLICTVLKLDGHNVRAICDTLSELNSLKTLPPVDLLLTDIKMKPISGFEIVKRLAKLGFDRPVIFTSGYPAEYWAAVEGKQDLEILEKPFTAAELRAAVANAMAKTTRKPAKRKAIAATAKSRTTSMAG